MLLDFDSECVRLSLQRCDSTLSVSVLVALSVISGPPNSLIADDGRVFFTVPNLFETSISLIGATSEDGWFFVHVKFLHNVGGDQSGLLGATQPISPG